MRTLTIFEFIACLCCLSATVAHAGETSNTAAERYSIIFKSGQTLDGKILSRDADSLTLEVEYGSMRIEKEKVLRIEGETDDQKSLREKMQADGKVLYAGKWVTKEEREKFVADVNEKANKVKVAMQQKQVAAAEAAKKTQVASKYKASDFPDVVNNVLRNTVGPVSDYERRQNAIMAGKLYGQAIIVDENGNFAGYQKGYGPNGKIK